MRILTGEEDDYTLEKVFNVCIKERKLDESREF